MTGDVAISIAHAVQLWTYKPLRKHAALSLTPSGLKRTAPREIIEARRPAACVPRRLPACACVRHALQRSTSCTRDFATQVPARPVARYGAVGV